MQLAASLPLNKEQALIPNSENPYQQAKSPDTGQNPYTPVDDFIPNAYDLPVHKDIRDSFVADRNRLQSEQSSKHIRSLIATILFIVGEVVGLVVYFKMPGTLTSGQVIAICIGSYVVYLLLACICNDLHSYLSHISHGSNFQNNYDITRAQIGNFYLHAVCYHYETRYHTRTVTDSNGQSHQQSYTTTQKVITHTGYETVTPAKTDDTSGQVDRIRAKKNIVFINFQLSYSFKDEISRNNFDRIYHRFKAQHRRDVHQDYSYNYQIPGFIDKQAFYVGTLDCSYRAWFYIFGIFFMVWPYSLWVQQKVDRFSIPITKVLTI